MMSLIKDFKLFDGIYLTLLTILITSLVVNLLYILNNGIILKFAIMANRSYSGMTIKYIKRKNGDGVWCYAEKGNSHHKHDNQRDHKKYPTLVFLHGIGINKDSWTLIVRKIPSFYHCVVVDMPGHGDTTFIEGVDQPNLEGYVKSVREFLELTHLDNEKIFLIGCSFGGAVASLFAHDYPDLVSNLALVCPAMKTPVLSEVHNKLLDGDYTSLIPQNGKQLANALKLISFRFKVKYLPLKIMDSYINLSYTPQKRQLLSKILDSMLKNSQTFETEGIEKIKKIKASTLIIWGEDDKVLHVSGANKLKECIENCQVNIFTKCNHAVFMDRPTKTAHTILNFINNY